MHAEGAVPTENILTLVRDYSQVGLCIEVSCNKCNDEIII